jgi:hypothetical protein
MYAECLEKAPEKSWSDEHVELDTHKSVKTWVRQNDARSRADIWYGVSQKPKLKHGLVRPQQCMPPTFQQRFNNLVARWRADTAFSSSDTDVVMHPAYQDVIGMGKRAIPLILKELQASGGNWFWALRHISGENPIDPRDVGKTRKMAEAWIRWGQDRRYL